MNECKACRIDEGAGFFNWNFFDDPSLNLLEEISSNSSFGKTLIKYAIRKGYSNKRILEAVRIGIENDIKTYNEKSFAADGRLAVKKAYSERIEEYKKLQEILNQNDLSDGKKLHNYLKSASY
ncbi:MAG: hypothetical protein WA139_01715 [Candidatus Aenigmatarchaeota archaeon]